MLVVTIGQSYRLRISSSQAGAGFFLSETIQVELETRNSRLETYLACSKLGNLVAEIVLALSEALAHLVASKAAHGDTLPDCRNLLSYQFADCLGRLFDERLIEQHHFFVELVEPPLDDLVDNSSRET